MPTPRNGSVSGELMSLVARLRRFASDRDSEAYLIEGSFERFGADVEAQAAAARSAVQGAADAVFQLVLALERTPEYKRQVKGTSDGLSSAVGPERA